MPFRKLCVSFLRGGIRREIGIAAELIAIDADIAKAADNVADRALIVAIDDWELRATWTHSHPVHQ